MNYLQCAARWIMAANLLLITACLAGCAAPSAVQPGTRGVTAASAEAYPKQKQTKWDDPTATRSSEGSLWADNGSLSEMFINAKARRAGDIITIRITESSSASNNASTNTGRTTSMSFGLSNLFGMENNAPTSAILNPFGTVKSGYESEFDGSGTTARSGALSAYITARIVQVKPNGNLLIEGNREVRINNENQVITLTGVIRPRDISSDNVIQSTYIADARISYSGSGVINEQQRPGWLARLFDSIWPF
jgi:flagellar L-ring protein precursor FlgH